MPCVWGQQGAPRVALPAEMVSRAWVSGNADAEEEEGDDDDEEGGFAPAPPVGYTEFVEAAPAPAGTEAQPTEQHAPKEGEAEQCEGGRA